MDADALSRQAIEATAIAYRRLWKYPELRDENAYENHEKENHPNQWRPSFKYNETFKLDQLFSEPEAVWTHLRSVHDAASAVSTHAGPLATVFHVERDRTVLLQFIELDNGLVRLTWNRMLDLYFEMLMIFLRILRGSVETATITAFEQEMQAGGHKRQLLLTSATNRRQASWRPANNVCEARLYFGINKVIQWRHGHDGDETDLPYHGR